MQAAAATTPAAPAPLLEVRDLRMHFPIKESTGIGRQKKVVQAVDGVSFDLEPGGSLGLVGDPAVANPPPAG